MRRILLSVILCFLLGYTLYGTEEVDSLEKALEKNLTLDTNRVNLLNQLGFNYWIIDPNQSERYGKQALELSRVLEYDKGLAFAKRIIGVAHWARGNYESALELLFQSLERYKDLKDPLGEANSTMNIGMVYGDQLNYKQALEYYDLAINLFEPLKEQGRIATTYTKIGIVYAQQKQYEPAYDYFSKAVVLHEKQDYLYGIAEVNQHLGNLFLDKGDVDKGLSYLFRGLEASEEKNDQHGLAGAYQKIGHAYLKKKDFRQSETYLKKGLAIANRLGIKTVQKAVYLDLKNLAKAGKNYPVAMNYFEKYVAISDSIFNEEKATQVTNLQVQYALASQEQELKIKQQEIALLEQQNRASNLLRWLMLVLFGVFSYFAYRYFKFQQKRLKRNKERLLDVQALRQADQKQAETELGIAQATNEELKEQIELKNKELTSYTLNFIRKNELMHELRTTITKIKKSASDTISSQLNGLQRQIDSALHIDQDWEDFRIHFEQVHSNFFTNIKNRFPELSGNDLKLCSLIRLNLSSKEIATMLGISPDSVKTARYRLRKKMKMERDESLLDFLVALDQNSAKTNV